MLLVLLCWLPLAGPLYWWMGDRNFIALITMPLLYGEFILLAQLWGRFVYSQPDIFRCYGLAWSQQMGLDLLAGMALGLTSVLLLFGLQGCLGWLNWQSAVGMPLWRVIPEGCLMGLAIGLLEELLFRGWLLDELERDYRPMVALWVNALVYALAHFIKPLSVMVQLWPIFPSLFVLGCALVWAKRAHEPMMKGLTFRNRQMYRGLLGLPIGLHAGLVWGYYIINVGQLVRYTHVAPTWLTGIDNNPLGGVMGLFALSAIALGMKTLSQRQRRW